MCRTTRIQLFPQAKSATKRSLFFRAVLLGIWAVFGMSTAFGQADVATATLKGAVTDSTNAAVAGAAVSVRSVERGIARAVQTDASGIYQIPLLQPGAYELYVQAAGFEPQTQRNVVLTIGQSAVYNIKLSIGELAGEAAVVAQIPLIEVERTQQANTIEQRQIANLPTLTRIFTDYIFTLPGVAGDEPARAQQTRVHPLWTSGFSIGGSNGRTNYITVDGSENESGAGGMRARNISVEAVQEFQVNRNAFSAEYGFTAGTAVNAITKSGTNQVHGSGYAFYRSQKTSARDPFDFGARKPFEQAFYPGFTLGGPIVRGKAFFFTSYEAFKFDRARFRSYTSDVSFWFPSVPQTAYLTLLETGAGANADTRRIAANLRRALAPVNFPTAMQLVRASEGHFNSPTRSHNWTSRLDYQPTAQDSLSGRFTLADENVDLLGANNIEAPSRGIFVKSEDITAVGSWSRLFGNYINQLRAQFSNYNLSQHGRHTDSAQVNIAGFIDYGRGPFVPLYTAQERYLLEDLLSWNRGRHNFTIGASYRPVSLRVTNEFLFSGLFLFGAGLPLQQALPAADQAVLTGALAPPAATTLTSLQAFSLGLPQIWQQGFGNPSLRGVQHNLGIFAQDSWKIRPNLTLDLGVRLDYDGEPMPIGANTYVSPRVGFAWDVWGNHKTVVRGGAGTYYAPITLQIFASSTLFSDSGQNINIASRTLLDGAQSSAALWAYGQRLGKLPFQSLTESDVRAFGITTGPQQPNRRVADVAADYDNPYSIQASFGISQQLSRNTAIEISYLMYRGVHLPVPIETNFRESGQFVTVPGSDQGYLFGPRLERINPQIAQQITYASVGNSIYHGMTASLNRRVSGLFQFQVNYTYSKTIDDVLDFNASATPFLPTRRFLERAVSAYDMRHNFVASGVFDSPFKSGAGNNLLSRALADITLSPIVWLRSGVPFNLYIGRDVNGDANATDRPFYAPRNSGIGPNFYSVNLRFTKRFYIARQGSEGLRVDFITEAANLFNHTNFLRVNDTVCGAFAQPGFINGCDPRFLTGPFDFKGRRDLPATAPLGFVGAGSPRQLQFGLKVAF